MDGLPLALLLAGMEPATWLNGTRNLSLSWIMPNQLSHRGQGTLCNF